MMPVRRSPLRLYASALGAIIAGAAAAYFKIQADNQNDLYLLTGDPAAWSKVRKYRYHFSTLAYCRTDRHRSIGVFSSFRSSQAE